jgi:uncharacterized SAM-binding protein YcdF (DUF218 family)
VGSEETSSRERWRRAGLGAALGALTGLIAKELDLPSLVSYWYARAPLVLLSALLGALLWQTRLRWLVGALSGAAFGLWLLVAFTPLSRLLARDLSRRDAPSSADAVFVLSSGLQADDELTSAAMTRLLRGLELLEGGKAPRIILSELHPPQPSYALPARELMKNLGLDQELLTVGPVGNTRDEAVAVAALFRARGWRRLLVVTTPAHSRRACAAFEREGLEVTCLPSTETRYDFENLEKSDDRIFAFGGLLHEWIGLFVYRQRGWL